MNVPELILGSWKANDRDLVVTFLKGNTFLINHKHPPIPNRYFLSFEQQWQRWKLVADSIGLYISFVKEVNDAKLIIENVGEPGSMLRFDHKGNIVSGVTTELFIKID